MYNIYIYNINIIVGELYPYLPRLHHENTPIPMPETFPSVLLHLGT